MVKCWFNYLSFFWSDPVNERLLTSFVSEYLLLSFLSGSDAFRTVINKYLFYIKITNLLLDLQVLVLPKHLRPWRTLQLQLYRSSSEEDRLSAKN